MTTQKELNEMFVGILGDISQICERITTGNISHNISTIRCKCKDMLAFYNKYPINPWHSIAEEDLPKEEKLYLCGDNSDYIIGEWNAEKRRFTDPFSRFDNQRIDWVQYWMEIPILPSE